MTLDVTAVVDALFKAGVETIRIKDFHRTGYNILPEYLDRRAEMAHGYEIGPVPGIGNLKSATALMMIGMHAPSGSNGFLSHTLTSRIAKLEVNGELMSEAQLFSASVAPFGLSPVFFSACPVACEHTQQKLKGTHCFPIDKPDNPKNFEAERWRQQLAAEAVHSLQLESPPPYLPNGPFSANVYMRDGEAVAKKLAKRWEFSHDENRIYFQSDTIDQLYLNLMRICYLTPFAEKILPFGIKLFNARGGFGLYWARKQLQKTILTSKNIAN